MKQERLPIICFAGSDWWYHNRGLFCPQVMTRLAKDYKVLVCQLMRGAIKKVGTMDERFFMYADETDWFTISCKWAEK